MTGMHPLEEPTGVMRLRPDTMAQNIQPIQANKASQAGFEELRKKVDLSTLVIEGLGVTVDTDDELTDFRGDVAPFAEQLVENSEQGYKLTLLKNLNFNREELGNRRRCNQRVFRQTRWFGPRFGKQMTCSQLQLLEMNPKSWLMWNGYSDLILLVSAEIESVGWVICIAFNKRGYRLIGLSANQTLRQLQKNIDAKVSLEVHQRLRFALLLDHLCGTPHVPADQLEARCIAAKWVRTHDLSARHWSLFKRMTGGGDLTKGKDATTTESLNGHETGISRVSRSSGNNSIEVHDLGVIVLHDTDAVFLPPRETRSGPSFASSTARFAGVGRSRAVQGPRPLTMVLNFLERHRFKLIAARMGHLNLAERKSLQSEEITNFASEKVPDGGQNLLILVHNVPELPSLRDQMRVDTNWNGASNAFARDIYVSAMRFEVMKAAWIMKDYLLPGYMSTFFKGDAL
ncbi:hypothetical protein TcWFU_007158 [Taenia crassiceps]|uniref:Uncharacterized protein n=1 Tax=Taenia crassiceps TaxID=6207 RepID=A0ABR4QS25_9CEST